MALPVTLDAGWLAVIVPDASLNGITPVAPLQYGYLDAVYSGYTTHTAGDFLHFRTDERALELSYGGEQYYYIHEDNIIGIENPLP